MTTAPQRYPEQEADDNQQIDVTDIIQLVRTANEKGYIKTSDDFSKPKGEFKSRTLKDIAESNMQAIKDQAQAKPAIAATSDSATTGDDEDHPHQEAEQKADQDAIQDGEESAEHAPENKQQDKQQDASPSISENDQTPPDQADADQHASPEAPAGTQEAPEETPEEAPEKANKDTPDADSTEADGFKTTISPAQQTPIHAATEAEYARGVEEGKAAAHAEIDANLNAAMSSFIAAANAISKEDSIDIAQLESAMFSAINQLASERAGIEIDKNPAPFAAKVMAMVSRIRNRIETPVIHLHPEDIMAIQPQLEAQLAPRQFTLLADETMKRSDVRVDVGSIGVMDLLDDQPAQKPSKARAKSDPSKAKHKADTATDKPADDDSKNSPEKDVSDE